MIIHKEQEKDMKVFIDGSEGTTGLRIYERFENRSDIELIKIDPELRKDPEARKKCINESEVTFLCLPDAASIESVSLCENENVTIIDTSTAHRVNPDWTYGFQSLIRTSGRKSEIPKESQSPAVTPQVL